MICPVHMRYDCGCGLARASLPVLLALSSCAPLNAAEVCSPTDVVMAAHAVECRLRVERECAGVPDADCPAIDECDAWGEARCK